MPKAPKRRPPPQPVQTNDLANRATLPRIDALAGEQDDLEDNEGGGELEELEELDLAPPPTAADSPPSSAHDEELSISLAEKLNAQPPPPPWYLATLPAKQLGLENALETLRQGDPGATSTLRSLAHRIRGSSAMVGLKALAEVARAAEAADTQEIDAATNRLLLALRNVGTGGEAQSTVLVVGDAHLAHRLGAVDAPGARVSFARNAAELAQSLAEERIDVLVVTMDPTRYGGVQLLSSLRSTPGLALMPLLAVGCAGCQGASAAYASGADGFIGHNSDLSLVASQLSAVLSNAHERHKALLPHMVTHLPNITALYATHVEFGRGSSFSASVLRIYGLHTLSDAQRATLQRDVTRQAEAMHPTAIAQGANDEWALLWLERDRHQTLQATRRLLQIIDPLCRSNPIFAGLTLRAVLAMGGTRQSARSVLDKARWALAWPRHTEQLLVLGEDDVVPAPRLLIVDDDPDLIRILSGQLVLAGFDVSEARDGFDALAQIDTQPYDLVIVDLALPDLDGVELIRQIRDIDRHRDTPIIVLTAQSNARRLSEAFQAGADQFLPKPHRRSDLLQRIDTLLLRLFEARARKRI